MGDVAKEQHPHAFEELRSIMARLRAPNGCPWDREQTHHTLRGSLLEEAYEVLAAIEAGDDENLCEELGDLLLQVVFHAQIAEDEGRFDVLDVAHGIGQKLIRRHPHVFGSESAEDSAAVLQRWDELKKLEKKASGAAEDDSALAGITPGLPALLHAEKVQKKAAKVGFDWAAAAPVIEKIREETAEVEAAIAAERPEEMEDEIGDLLFSVVNLARQLKIEPEVALQRATRKFADRFRAMEMLAKEREIRLPGLSLPEMDQLWDEVKRTSV